MRKKNRLLSDDDRAFADLILLGYNKADAYRKIYTTNAKGRSVSVMAQRQYALPEVKAYIDARRAKAIANVNAEKRFMEEERQDDKNASESVETTSTGLSLTETEKSKYIRELERLKTQVDDPMDKAKIIAQITDLKQLKKEQTETQQQVKYYLPLPENEFKGYIIECIKTDSQFADNIRVALANSSTNIAN